MFTTLLTFWNAHSTLVLTLLLTASETMALVFPNATGIVKAISLLRSAGAKDVDGQ